MRKLCVLLVCGLLFGCGGDPVQLDPDPLDGGSQHPPARDGGSPDVTLLVDAGPDLAVCAGARARIGPPAIAGLQYAWSPAVGLDAADVAQPLAAPDVTTTYTLTVTNPATGAVGTDSVVVAVHAAPVARITTPAGGEAPAKVCGGQPWEVTASTSSAAEPATLTVYAWSLSEGGEVVSTEQTPTLALPAGAASYAVSLEVTDSNGCQARTSVPLSVLPLPVASAGPDVLVVPGGSTVIGEPATDGTAPYAYAWTAEPACAEGTCLSSASEARPTVSPAETSTFTVTVTDAEGCTASDAVQVGVPAPLVASAGGDQGVCAGGSLPLGAPAQGGVPPYTYAWTASPACTGCLSATDVASPVASPTQTTTFTQTVTDALGSTASASVQLTVLPPPGTAGDDVSLEPGASAFIGPTAVEGATYRWSCNREDCALSSTSEARPVASPLRSTRYTLEASSGGGCTVQSSTTVWVALRATTVPADGEAAFPVGSPLTVAFDQAVAPSTLSTSTVRLTSYDASGAPSDVAVALSYDAATHQLTVTPVAELVAGTDYTLTLVGGPSGIASDDAVLPSYLTSDVLVDFTAAPPDTTPPAIVFRSPGVDATGVSPNTTVRVGLDEALDAATVSDASVTLSTGGAAVAATVSYDAATYTITLVPSVALAPFTLYRVDLAAVADLSGNTLSEGWSFTTGAVPDTTPPTVTSVSPADGATGVLAASAIQLTFSEDVDATSLGGITLLDVASGLQVAGTVTYNALTRVATFQPSSLLGSLAVYRVSVAGVEDLAGNAMAAPFTSTFTTRAILFSDGFEQGTEKWLLPAPVSGTGSSWGLTSAVSRSPTHSLTDSVVGPYAPNLVSVAQLAAPVDVTGLDSVTLQLWMRGRLQRGDALSLEVSLDGGVTWTLLPAPAPSKDGRYTGNLAAGMRTHVVGVSGQTQLLLRFLLQTDDVRNRDGVYVDDVVLQTP